MLRTVTHLQGFTLRAIDGEIGKVDQFYCDDETWAIRYLVVNTGNWLPGRLVLISPIAIGQTDLGIKASWGITDEKAGRGQPRDRYAQARLPATRGRILGGYYGYPFYWSGPYLWGPMSDPAGVAMQRSVVAEAWTSRTETESTDSHLRSTKEVIGYHIEATDGEIGHVENFIVDHHTWAIQYIEVKTRNWWPGKKVLISPHWIERVSWTDSKVYVDLFREAIKNGPEYIDSIPITREYEHKLWDHYKQPAYWLQGAEQLCSPTVSKD